MATALSSQLDINSQSATTFDQALSGRQHRPVRRSKSKGPGIAQRLKIARGVRGMTIAEVAKAAQTSPQTLHSILLGSGGTSQVDLMADIAKALGVRLGWLVLGEEPRDKPESDLAAVRGVIAALPKRDRDRLVEELCGVRSVNPEEPKG